MTTILLGLTWLLISGLGLASLADFERRSRVRARPDRPELAPPRAIWGGGAIHPPARAAVARALAGFARLVRRRAPVVEHRRGLRRLSRGLACGSIAIGLALVPVAGTWGGGEGPPLVLLDQDVGLVLVVLISLALSFARIAIGVAERSTWSRLGAARQASRSLAGTALLVLAMLPLAVDAGSLRLHDLVVAQQRVLWPFEALVRLWGEPQMAWLEAWPLPAWNLFTQPLTALLFASAIALHVGSPRADAPGAGSISVAGLGLDADPTELYWIRVEARFATLFGGALFVALFLGGGGLPLVDPALGVERLTPFVGRAVSQAAFTLLYVGAFGAKLVLILYLASRAARLTAPSRDDRSLRLALRRLLPIAWANLLLVVGVTLWLDGAGVGA